MNNIEIGIVKIKIEFFHEQANTGHHLAVVYGDYTQELKGLGDLMNFEVVEIE